MTEEKLIKILGGCPVNNTIYTGFFDSLYAAHPEMIDTLLKEHSSFRNSSDVSGLAQADIGGWEAVQVHNKNYRAADDGKYCIDKEKDIYLDKGDNNDQKKDKLIRVCNWLCLSNEEVEELLKPALEKNGGRGRLCEEDASMMEAIFGGRKITGRIYKQFFIELYNADPVMLANLGRNGCRFTDDPINGRNGRNDLGSYDLTNPAMGHRNNANPGQDRHQIGKAHDLWLVVAGPDSTMKRKLLWVCRKLDISPETARFYLFGIEPGKESDESEGNDTESIPAEEKPTDTPVENESTNETAVTPNVAEPETDEPAEEGEAISLEGEIDSAIDKLQKQWADSFGKTGTDLNVIITKRDKLINLKKELSDLKGRIRKALSE